MFFAQMNFDVFDVKKSYGLKEKDTDLALFGPHLFYDIRFTTKTAMYSLHLTS